VRLHRRLSILAAPAFFFTQPTVVGAQIRAPIDVRDEYFAGSELEAYLRTLQTLGIAPAYPWSLRKLSPREIDRLMPADTAFHPWAGRFDFSPGPRPHAYARWLRPQLGARVNSGFPWGLNDGAVWAGRGVTGWASGGFAARWGALSLVVDPIAFTAQNADFPIVENGRPGALRFGEARFSGGVDYPQRFGDRPYARLDAGESTLRLDYAGASAGVSTAHEWWGPSQRFPYLLGTNAGGFPHVFLGTGRPADLWLLKLHGRVLWGQLDESPYFQATGVSSFLTRPRRFATGLTVVLQPRGLDQLELGLSRFIHAPWPDSGLPGRYVFRSFEGIFKKNLRVGGGIPTDDRSRDGENQLASVFGRFSVPAYGFEVYGEFGREDHPWDGRYLILTPDEQSSMTFGVAKSWLRPGRGRITRLRGESINFQQSQVDKFRGGRPTYTHQSGSNQGHTQRGQILGAGVGVSSAAGAFAALDFLERNGRWTVEWSRIVRQDRGAEHPELQADRRALDVVHSVSAERLLFWRGLDVLGGVSAAYDFNRDFLRDRGNVSLYLSLTGRP
jgi:hypothetical protein